MGVEGVEYSAADAEILDLLEPAVREWWIERFGEVTSDTDGLFTPPQREAIPLVHQGTNTLVCAPTGSGKCVKPDTPLIVEEEGAVEVVRARELLERRGEKVATVDRVGELYASDIEAFALQDGEVGKQRSMLYTEPYSGEITRVKTTYGREVEVTPSHPLLIEGSDGSEWRAAKNIREGDRIGVPKRIDLPEEPVRLDVKGAIEALRERFSFVVTHLESVDIAEKLDSAHTLGDLEESEIRGSLALADLSMNQVADYLSIGLSTVHEQVTDGTEYRGKVILQLLRKEIDPLQKNEVLVKTNNGGVSRFTYPTEVDEDLSKLTAFVLAEGLLAEYERNAVLMISQRKRSDLLEEARRTMNEKFDVKFKRKNEKDYLIGGTAFAIFFSELLKIERGRSRDVRLPDWIMNASKDLKRAFVSTFLSLEAEVSERAIVVTQANEMKIEQLNYLLLSFGVVSARGTTIKYATNTEEQTRREYYTLSVQRKRNLSRFFSEFDVCHENTARLIQYADGTGSGNWVDNHEFDYTDIRQLSSHYVNDQAFNEELGNVYEVVRRSGRITGRALESLADTVESLPEDRMTTELSRKINRMQERNVMWLEVTSTETYEYEGQVIDLTVPGPHNFVGGYGAIYLHNTLASFTSIINELFRRARDQGLENTVYCLYVSPLKSLANDIHRNLEVPLDGIHDNLRARGDEVDRLRHAIRHGDTDDAARQKMLEETPHILNTTPETLAILLNSPRFKEKLRTVEYVIVDEIHSLADNKRGTHLSVSLERLENLTERSPTRIGCSATVEPITEMAEFLVGRTGSGGAPRDYEVVDARFVRDFDLELVCPTDDLIGTPGVEVRDRFYHRLHSYIRDHRTTLVFTNTRSGAERVLYNLRERFGYDETNSGCHHGSLSREVREEVEGQLKAGEIDVVTTSTSLELGIDMPTLDLVVQVGSPKSVAALLQRVGRAGHRPGDTVEGRVIALDRDELVECAVMLRKAEQGFVDRVFIPERAHDVAAQHVYGMAINQIRREADVLATLRRAYPYRDYSDREFEDLMRYLTADYDGLEDRNVYAKVWRDTNDPPEGDHHYPEFPVGEPLIGKRGRLARPIYMQNIGTIPDSFSCTVLARESGEWLGDLDESYLDTLEPGDVFVLGGARYAYRYRRGSNVYVDPTDARPTVPSWFSERLPLSYDLGRAILQFQNDVLDRLDHGGRAGLRDWLRDYPIDENAVYALSSMFAEQVAYGGAHSLSTDQRLVVEEEHDQDAYKRRFYVHTTYGRRFNDGLSRVVANRCAQATDANVGVAVADNGFSLSMPLNRKVDVATVIRGIDPEEVREDLRTALDGTDLLQRYFRINATRSLMILRRYKGHEKSPQKQQISSEMLLGFAERLEDFAVIEETYREIVEDKLDLAAIESVLGAVQAGEIDVVGHIVSSPTPRAFGLATLAASDVVLAEDESAVLRAFHERVTSVIDADEA